MDETPAPEGVETGRGRVGAGETCASADVPEALPDPGRRELLAAGGSSGALALAGCLDDGDTPRYLVGFDQDGERTEVEVSDDERLLYPALDAGVEIPHRCEVGRCGDCTVKYAGDANDVAVHDGNEYLTDEQVSDGWVLTCVAYARDDFDVEVTQPTDD